MTLCAESCPGSFLCTVCCIESNLCAGCFLCTVFKVICGCNCKVLLCAAARFFCVHLHVFVCAQYFVCGHICVQSTLCVTVSFFLCTVHCVQGTFVGKFVCVHSTFWQGVGGAKFFVSRVLLCARFLVKSLFV